MVARSILARPLDLFFVVFFILHIPTTLLIGSQNFIPADLVPPGLRAALINWADQSGDPWLTRIKNEQPLPPWWLAICAVEIGYQLPWFFWYIYSAVVDSPSIRIGSIIYAVQCSMSLVPILSELVFAHPELPADKRAMVFSAYIPYLIVPMLLLARYTIWWGPADEQRKLAKKKKL